MDVLENVANTFGVSVRELRSQARNRSIAYPRFAAFHIMRHQRGLSYSQIGRIVGGRDHSTIIHGVQKTESLIHTDDKFAANFARASLACAGEISMP